MPSHLLCVCYLENHVFFGTRIDRKISARDVLNRRVLPAHLFRARWAKKFLHGCSWSRVFGTKTFNPHSTLIQPSLWCPEIRGSVAHPRAFVATIQASSWCRMMNLRPLLACNWGQYFTFPASDWRYKKSDFLNSKSTVCAIYRILIGH
jgi:hypothetical protein